MLATAAAATWPRPADARELSGVVQPKAVAGGQEAVPCQWPDTIAVTAGGSLCSGSLVHPRVVVFAAHCGEGDKVIRFGESSDFTAAHSIETDFCMVNPEYVGTTSQGQDWAFCVLSEEITDLPVTPPLYGCELDVLAAGLPVVIAGFGQTGIGGSGTKHWANTTVVSTFGNTINIGGDGVSTCSGDSGGSAFVQIDDGSWRSISMVSTGIECGLTGVHALMHPAVPWIEENSQVDITPCHDVDGTWNPTGACTGFFAGGDTPAGEWATWCQGTPVSGPSDTCGAPFDAEPDDEAPTVTITSPGDGEELASGTPVTIAIDAVDAGWGVRSVWVSIDGVEQMVRDDYAPYVFADVPFPDGVYTLVAFAEDWNGLVGESAPVTIGVGAEVPDDPDSSGGPDGSTGGGATAGTDGSATGAVDGGTDGLSTVGMDEDDTGGGCQCRSEASTPAAMLVLVPLVGRRRRRD
jgi:MYXO-CTERM domain-containing protein